MILAFLLAGCSSGNHSKIRKPQGTPTLPPVEWLRPQTAISQNNPVVHLSGLMRLHQSTVNGIAFSASGTRMASVGADDTIVIWNLANGEPLFVQGDNDGRRVFWGPNDETLITVSPVGLTRIWSLDMSLPRKLVEQTSFVGQDEQMTVVAQSPDRSLLAFGSPSGGIRIWRVPEGVPVADFQAHGQSVLYLAFSPDGQALVSLGANRGVRVWSVPDANLVYDVGREEIGDNSYVPQRADFSPDSKTLVVANDQGIQLWSMESGELIYFVETALNAAASKVIFSPDGKLLVGCGQQPLIGVWEASTGKSLGLLPLPGQVCANVSFSPDSSLLLTLPTPGRDLYLWNIVHITDDVPVEQKMLDRADRQTMGLFTGPRFLDIAWSVDGRFIIVLDELGPIYVLSAAQ
jgi:WD40 repeat protein